MKKLAQVFFTIAALLVTSICYTRICHASQVDEQEAVLALNSYFNALYQGNILALKSILAEDILEKRMVLLNNPTYAQHLMDTYSKSSYEIDSIKIVDNHIVEINTKLRITTDDISYLTYTLRRVSIPGSNASVFKIVREAQSESIQ